MKQIFSRVTVFCLLISSTAESTNSAFAQTETLRSDQPYSGELTDAVTYDIDFRVIVTAPYHSKTLKVWLPIPPSDVIQTVKTGEFSTFPELVSPQFGTETMFGNRFAYFEFENPQGAQIIQHNFQVTTSEVHWRVEPDRVHLPDKWPPDFEKYLNSDSAVTINSDIAKLAKSFQTTGHQPFQELSTAMDWLNLHMTYNHSAASLQASSLHAFNTQQGHCSDYHGLCSAFGRVLGFPTRVTYGMAPFPKNSPSHCKLEVFLPDYGWVSFDVSETQKLIKAISTSDELTGPEKEELVTAAIRRLNSGYRDNTWFLQTRGTDYELAPPAANRVNVVRTIYAEADGVPLPEPDPSDESKITFSWMTAHQFKASREVNYPFKDWTTLKLPPKNTQ